MHKKKHFYSVDSLQRELNIEHNRAKVFNEEQGAKRRHQGTLIHVLVLHLTLLSSHDILW